MSFTDRSPAPADGPGRPEPGLRLVRAPNPGPMTERGTNSWILGEGRVAVIDPGPGLPAHLAAIEAALAPGERVAQVLVTHAHADHAGLARTLAARWRAPVLAFGPPGSGRSARMAALAATAELGGGEGAATGFRPDEVLADGAELAGEGWRLVAHRTPGHTGDHLCFAWGDVVFSGDHVMGWASSMVSPPDGDMAAYMASLDRLAALQARRLLPGHGDPVEEPGARIAQLKAHRLAREAAILAALADGPETPAGLAARLYADTPPALLPAATRNVLAHLIALAERGAVAAEGLPGPATRFAPA